MLINGQGNLVCNASILAIGSRGILKSANITAKANVTGKGSKGLYGLGTSASDANLSGDGILAIIGEFDEIICGASIESTGIVANVFGMATTTGYGIKKIKTNLTKDKTTFIPFGDKLYILNGHDYLVYDGSICERVEGYRPLVGIGGSPSGVNNVPFEGINLLTGSKHITRRSDGTATEYLIPENNVDSIDFVKYLGTLLTLGVDYTQDLVLGKITMVLAKPAANVDDDVDIGWTKGTGNRELIENCRYAIDYSGQTDSRLFLWGNANHKNTRYWSELANGVPSAEYFTATSQDTIGSGEYAITDIIKQYDRQKIFFENTAMYSYYDFTNNIVSFPVFELSEEVGNLAPGQARVINNMPFTLHTGVRAWESSTVRDQTNQVLMSKRISDTLDNQDLTKAITVDWKENKEYWLNIGNSVWVYNYQNNTWYNFDNIKASQFIVINGVLYFCNGGNIFKFNKEALTDNGIAIKAKWESGFSAFEQEWITKFMSSEYVGLYPDFRSRIDFSIITDNEGLIETQSIVHNHATYSRVDYNNWSYSTSYNPQPKKIDIQANRFVYIKMVLENTSEIETALVLNITLPARLGGKI